MCAPATERLDVLPHQGILMTIPTPAAVNEQLAHDRKGETTEERRTLALEMIADQLALIHGDLAQRNSDVSSTYAQAESETSCGNS